MAWAYALLACASVAVADGRLRNTRVETSSADPRHATLHPRRFSYCSSSARPYSTSASSPPPASSRRAGTAAKTPTPPRRSSRRRRQSRFAVVRGRRHLCGVLPPGPRRRRQGDRAGRRGNRLAGLYFLRLPSFLHRALYGPSEPPGDITGDAGRDSLRHRLRRARHEGRPSRRVFAASRARRPSPPGPRPRARPRGAGGRPRRSAGCRPATSAHVTATGYGRMAIPADRRVTEITCHARGALAVVSRRENSSSTSAGRIRSSSQSTRKATWPTSS